MEKLIYENGQRPPLRLIAAYGIMESVVYRKLPDENSPIGDIQSFGFFQIFTTYGWDEQVEAMLVERIQLSADHKIVQLEFIDLSQSPAIGQFIMQYLGAYSLN